MFEPTCQTTESAPRRFIIFSLPRCGSTGLTHILNTHPAVRCIIEPFHPRRHDGQFWKIAVDSSIPTALEVVWRDWNGLKHVWESSGWPFIAAPDLNDEIPCGEEKTVINLTRQNLLRRAVSNFITWHTRFWIGSKEDFHARLKTTELPPMHIDFLRAGINLDRKRVAGRTARMIASGARVLPLVYEDVFDTRGSDEDRLRRVNSIYAFLGHSPIDGIRFQETIARYFDPVEYQWASPAVYGLIPNIEQVEREVGNDETGWLFRETAPCPAKTAENKASCY